jgi:hypothetical protein
VNLSKTQISEGWLAGVGLLSQASNKRLHFGAPMICANPISGPMIDSDPRFSFRMN